MQLIYFQSGSLFHTKAKLNEQETPINLIRSFHLSEVQTSAIHTYIHQRRYAIFKTFFFVVEVERTIGFLKNRCQCLKYPPIKIRKLNDLVKCTKCIVVCCMLHNFIQGKSDDDGTFLNNIQHL
ncbi:hypothetical protein BDA99DRAFT_593191, partial [Phascolomyces articulosus]